MTKQDYYIDGNTVRKVSPQRRSDPNIKDINRRKARRKAARRNRERALSMNAGSLIMYSVVFIAVVFCAVNLIKLQASSTILSKQVATLQSQIEDMRLNNDARYKEITTKFDLNYIKNRAAELGMKPASEDQIIYYSVNNSNYMDQYEEIPEK